MPKYGVHIIGDKGRVTIEHVAADGVYIDSSGPAIFYNGGDMNNWNIIYSPNRWLTIYKEED